jgi:YVTN family beta-propeller protein
VATVGGGSLWIANYAVGSVTRIEVATRHVSTIPIGDPQKMTAQGCAPGSPSHDAPMGSFLVRACDLPSGLAFGFGSIWVTKNDAHAVQRIDLKTMRVLATIAIPMLAFDMTAGPSGIWLTDYEGGRVLSIDPTTNQVVVDRLVREGPSGLAITQAAVWIANTNGQFVTRLDPGTGAVVAEIQVGARPFPITVGKGGVWVRDEQDNTVSRIDSQTNRVAATIPIDPFYGRDGVDSLAIANGYIWVGGLRLQAIDPGTNRVSRVLGFQGRALAAEDGRHLWLLGIGGAIRLIDPMTA